MTSGNDKISLLVKVEQTFNLTSTVKKAYQTDKLYPKILENPKVHALFRGKDSLVFIKNLLRRDVLCIPHEAFQKGRQVIEIIINHAHTIIGHFNQFKTTQYIRRYCRLGSIDIATFVGSFFQIMLTFHCLLFIIFMFLF